MKSCKEQCLFILGCLCFYVAFFGYVWCVKTADMQCVEVVLVVVHVVAGS